MKVYRHGDVLIGEVDELPKEARARRDLVLARGEVTGHSHVVEPEGRAELYEMPPVHTEGRLIAPVLYLRVAHAPARVVHEEHGPIILPVGLYRVWRQREYDDKYDERMIED